MRLITVILSFSVMVFTSALGWTQSTEQYPVPLSLTSEKTGPNTITLLAYPKYYTDGEGELVPVETALQQSESPDWDYEVTRGVWILRVRKDGT